jgi:hypothetical protein
MKDKIINCVLVGVVLYFGVNWIADHPKKVKKLRKQMNHYVDTATDQVSDLMNK